MNASALGSCQMLKAGVLGVRKSTISMILKSMWKYTMAYHVTDDAGVLSALIVKRVCRAVFVVRAIAPFAWALLLLALDLSKRLLHGQVI